MPTAYDAAKVAIYWDFENVHAVLADKEHGEGAYRENRFTAQPVFLKLHPVIDYAASLGDVIINRAYGNWQWFHRYRDILNEYGVDLIQIFPRGTNMKNSADIRMALDAITDLHTYPHLTHIVIVSSDSDFISLAQKAKQSGKFIAGVGISGYSNKFWISSCNEFKFYETLVSVSESSHPAPSLETGGAARVVPAVAADSGGSLEEAREALVKAMTQLVARNGENYVARGAVKVFIKRLLPAFDEAALGCANFSDFLSRFSDLITVVDSISGGHVAFTNYAPPAAVEIQEVPAEETPWENEGTPPPSSEQPEPPREVE